MSTRYPFLGVLVALLCSLCLTHAETIREKLKPDSTFRIYSVIFGVTLDNDSKIEQFHISKVIDPKSGKTDAVDVKVPKKYVKAARKKFASKKHDPKLENGKPVEFFTYYYYSPDYPDVVITDLDAPIDKQP
jgi:hypothetical protein